MVDDNNPTTLLSVRTIETCGVRFALLEDDIVAVLTLIDDDDAALDRDMVRDLVGDMVMQVVSLGEQLFPTRASIENKVVVLRQDDDVFGLLVESAGTPAPATIQDPGHAAAPDSALSMVLGDTVWLADGTELTVLDRDRLALCTLAPGSTALN